jgi:multiple sugar transport system ATP-binding protein
MVFQNFALYPHLTVFQNLAFGLTLRKFPKADMQQRVKEAAEMLGLADCLDRKPGALSGGEQQRVALGRAIVRRPRVFLFDEPLSNLDSPKRAQMRAEIARLHSQLGATMLYVTHDQAEAMALGNRIAVMNAGEIQQIAAPMTLYEAPANVFVAGFVGSPPMNLFHGLIQNKSPFLYFVERSEKGQAAAEPFNVRICEEQAAWLKKYAGKPLVLGLRPEHLFAQTAASGQASADCVTANLEMIEPRGADTLLHLDTGTHRFTVRASSREAWRKPGRILVAFDMRQARFFHPDAESSLTNEGGQLVHELPVPQP